MNRPRFLADHDYDDDIADGLMRLQPDVDLILAREIEMQRSTDPELLEYAAREGRIILSHDHKTMIGFAAERVAAGERMPGLFVSPQRVLGPVLRDLMLICGASEAEEWEGMVVHLPFR